MNQVSIELWLGKKIGGDFEAISETRSRLREEVEEGTTIRQLLNHLARRNAIFALEVFDPEAGRLNSMVVVNYNDRIISHTEVYDQVIGDGDKITIVPVYAGG
jgi:sulfur carrier protein ThiS